MPKHLFLCVLHPWVTPLGSLRLAAGLLQAQTAHTLVVAGGVVLVMFNDL